jgi:hypothetical protein
MEYPSLEGANVGLKVYGSTGRIEVVIQEKSDEAPTVSERITDYLSAGGLFNPELMEHDKVRDLIIDAGDELGVGPLTPTVEDSRSTEILCGRP